LEQQSIRDLIKAGFHFGHRSSRWNPKMKPFIFKRRNQIHIIDLRETLRGLIVGRRLAKAVASQGAYVLFVGTKKQAYHLIVRESQRCGMSYVAERWPGGLLTNYVTIRSRLERLDELEELERTGDMGMYSKKMISSLRREKRKIIRNLGGVREMDRLPGLLIVVDPKRERIAVREAMKLRIPIIGLVDTDGNPDELDVVVPGNDDSIAAIEVFLRTMADAVLEGMEGSSGHGPVRQQPEAEEPASEQSETPQPEAEEPAVEQPETPQAEPAAGEKKEDEPAEEPAEQSEEEPEEIELVTQPAEETESD